MPYEMICVNSIHAMMPIPTAGADMPSSPHGETDRKPRPVPPANNASDSAAAMTAPANTAAQDTPDIADSRGGTAPP
ncbi:hypothetical protein D3C72_1871890 [compost metagenome]